MAFGDPEDLTQIARTLIATTAAADLSVDDQRSYTLIHLGDTGAGVGADEAIFFSFAKSGTGTAPTADFSAEANKLPLLDGQAIPIPPGIGTITYLTATANVAFGIVASAVWFGDH